MEIIRNFIFSRRSEKNTGFGTVPISDVSCYLFLRDRCRVTGEMENSRVLGYYYESENEKRDLGISRILALKKPEIPENINYY